MMPTSSQGCLIRWPRNHSHSPRWHTCVLVLTSPGSGKRIMRCIRRLSQSACLALDPPGTVTLRLDDHGVLHATGTAPYQWILEAQKLARVIPGITQLQAEQLVAVDRPEQILARVRTALT